MNRRAVLFWVGLAAVLIVMGYLTGGRAQDGEPLDPDSTGPLGTRALMLFLDEYGVSETRGLPGPDVTHALVLDDRLDPDQRRNLVAWARDGGTIVVTDPASPLLPDVAVPNVVVGGSLPAGVCDVDGLDGLDLEASSFVLYPEDVPPAGAGAAGRSCFGDGVESFVTEWPLGAGRLVVVGGGLVLTNRYLDEADNAVLAAALLVEEPLAVPGDTPTVAVLYDPILVAGSRTLGDLIPTGVVWAGWQLVIAFVLYALWRGIRFGRPVDEPQAVELPGSLLVRATAELHRRAEGHHAAAQALRTDLDRRLRAHLAAAPDLPRSELAARAAAGTDLTPALAEATLAGPVPTSGPELAALAADVDRIAVTVLGPAGPAGAGGEAGPTLPEPMSRSDT